MRRREFPTKVMVAAFERAKDHCGPERLRELLHYNPNTGIFTRLSQRGRYKAGAPTGCVSPVGYLQIRIDQRLYYAHRLAWLYVHGKWPAEKIDHIDCNKLNNRIANLRPATSQGNSANSGAHNAAGLKGAYWKADRKKWFSSITVEGHSRFLGYFPTPEKAHEAYVAAAKEAFGEFARAAAP